MKKKSPRLWLGKLRLLFFTGLRPGQQSSCTIFELIFGTELDLLELFVVFDRLILVIRSNLCLQVSCILAVLWCQLWHFHSFSRASLFTVCNNGRWAVNLLADV